LRGGLMFPWSRFKCGRF